MWSLSNNNSSDDIEAFKKQMSVARNCHTNRPTHGIVRKRHGTLTAALTAITQLSQCMRFPTLWHFDMCRLGQASAAFFLSLETPNGAQSVA